MRNGGEGPKGTSKYVLSLTQVEASLDATPPTGGHSTPAFSTIQWLESWRQREDSKRVLNRRMRTRMYGGRRPQQCGPYPDTDGYPPFGTTVIGGGVEGAKAARTAAGLGANFTMVASVANSGSEIV